MIAPLFRRKPQRFLKATQRQLRAGELLRKAICDILQRYDTWSADVSFAGITITRVEVSPDLRHASAYLTSFGGGDLQALVRALNGQASQIQRQLADKVTLKFLPLLRFRADDALEEAQRLESLFRDPKVQQDLA